MKIENCFFKWCHYNHYNNNSEVGSDYIAYLTPLYFEYNYYGWFYNKEKKPDFTGLDLTYWTTSGSKEKNTITIVPEPKNFFKIHKYTIIKNVFNFEKDRDNDD